MFYFFPKQLGQVNLEYIKYPTAGHVQSTIDPMTMDEVVTNVSDFEWPEFARELIVWFIVDGYATWNRESALKQIEQLNYQKATA